MKICLVGNKSKKKNVLCRLIYQANLRLRM